MKAHTTHAHIERLRKIIRNDKEALGVLAEALRCVDEAGKQFARLDNRLEQIVEDDQERDLACGVVASNLTLPLIPIYLIAQVLEAEDLEALARKYGADGIGISFDEEDEASWAGDADPAG